MMIWLPKQGTGRLPAKRDGIVLMGICRSIFPHEVIQPENVHVRVPNMSVDIGRLVCLHTSRWLHELPWVHCFSCEWHHAFPNATHEMDARPWFQYDNHVFFWQKHRRPRARTLWKSSIGTSCSESWCRKQWRLYRTSTSNSNSRRQERSIHWTYRLPSENQAGIILSKAKVIDVKTLMLLLKTSVMHRIWTCCVTLERKLEKRTSCQQDWLHNVNVSLGIAILHLLMEKKCFELKALGVTLLQTAHGLQTRIDSNWKSRLAS